MELTHGKQWSYAALIIGLSDLLLFYYGGFYAVVGVFIGFMGLVFMSMMYFMLYNEWESATMTESQQEIDRRMELAAFKKDEAKDSAEKG